MDNELRAVLHQFISAWIGEERIEKMMKEEGEYEALNDANRLHAGEKTREEVLDFLVGILRGMVQAFQSYHDKHGRYPEPPDFSKLPRIGRLEGLEEKKLNMSSLDAPVLQLRENDLGACLAEVSKDWREAFQREGIKLEAEFDPSIPIFRFDYPKLRQVIANLLDNALTHTPSGGSVRLNSTLRADGVEVSVTGALEHDQKIFDAYSP